MVEVIGFTPELNKIVRWKGAPGSIGGFSVTRIRGLSPCGRYALLAFICGAVPVKDLEPAIDPKDFFRHYKAIEQNHWLPNNTDLSTRETLPEAAPL